jgi:hypothetical protein
MTDPADLIRTLRLGDKASAERAARALKHISEADPTALYAWRRKLLQIAFAVQDVRVQWNLTIVIGRLPLRGADKGVAIDLMFERMRHPSGLNRTFALQALFDLSANDAQLRTRVLPLVHEALESGTPAMRARARRLLKVS